MIINHSHNTGRRNYDHEHPNTSFHLVHAHGDAHVGAAGSGLTSVIGTACDHEARSNMADCPRARVLHKGRFPQRVDFWGQNNVVAVSDDANAIYFARGGDVMVSHLSPGSSCLMTSFGDDMQWSSAETFLGGDLDLMPNATPKSAAHNVPPHLDLIGVGDGGAGERGGGAAGTSTFPVTYDRNSSRSPIAGGPGAAQFFGRSPRETAGETAGAAGDGGAEESQTDGGRNAFRLINWNRRPRLVTAVHTGTLLGESCVVAADDAGDIWIYRANCTSPPTVVTVGASTWGVSIGGDAIIVSANHKLVVLFRWSEWPSPEEVSNEARRVSSVKQGSANVCEQRPWPGHNFTSQVFSGHRHNIPAVDVDIASMGGGFDECIPTEGPRDLSIRIASTSIDSTVRLWQLDVHGTAAGHFGEDLEGWGMRGLTGGSGGKGGDVDGGGSGSGGVAAAEYGAGGVLDRTTAPTTPTSTGSWPDLSTKTYRLGTRIRPCQGWAVKWGRRRDIFITDVDKSKTAMPAVNPSDWDGGVSAAAAAAKADHELSLQSARPSGVAILDACETLGEKFNLGHVFWHVLAYLPLRAILTLGCLGKGCQKAAEFSVSAHHSGSSVLYCAASDGVFVLDCELRLLARYTPAKTSRTRARIPLPMAGSGGGMRKCDTLAVCNELSMIACAGKREEGACFELLDVTRKFGTEAYRLDSINFAGAHEDPRFMSKGLVLGITFGKCWGMRKVKTCYLYVMHETCILQYCVNGRRATDSIVDPLQAYEDDKQRSSSMRLLRLPSLSVPRTPLPALLPTRLLGMRYRPGQAMLAAADGTALNDVTAPSPPPPASANAAAEFSQIAHPVEPAEPHSDGPTMAISPNALTQRRGSTRQKISSFAGRFVSRLMASRDRKSVV